MIRIRLSKGLSEEDLISKFGFTKITENNREYFTKTLGQFEIQVKLKFPCNLRIQNLPDNRVPWILFKFILELEAKHFQGDTIRIPDSGYIRCLKIEDTKNLIEELSQYTDVKHRLDYWYKEFMKGTFKIDD